MLFNTFSMLFNAFSMLFIAFSMPFNAFSMLFQCFSMCSWSGVPTDTSERGHRHWLARRRGHRHQWAWQPTPAGAQTWPPTPVGVATDTGEPVRQCGALGGAHPRGEPHRRGRNLDLRARTYQNARTASLDAHPHAQNAISRDHL